MIRTSIISSLIVTASLFTVGCGAERGSDTAIQASTTESPTTATAQNATTVGVDEAAVTDPVATPPLTAAPTTSTTPPPPDVTEHDVRNMLLPALTCHGWADITEIPLTDGGFMPNLSYAVSIEGPVVYHDFDNDGGIDAAFFARCLVGANDSTGSVVVVPAGGDPWLVTDEVLLGATQLPAGSENRLVQTVTWADDELVIEWAALLPGDSYKHPTTFVRTTGAIVERSFVPRLSEIIESPNRPVTDASTPATPSADANGAKDFPFGSMIDVPKLGADNVRGSGCGLDGSIGDRLPDGWWFGHLTELGERQLGWDLICVYFGAEGEQRYQACYDEFGEEGCFFQDPYFFVENNNTRTRSVPIAADFQAVNPRAVHCGNVPLSPNLGGNMLLHIIGGQAVYLRYHCPQN